MIGPANIVVVTLRKLTVATKRLEDGDQKNMPWTVYINLPNHLYDRVRVNRSTKGNELYSMVMKRVINCFSMPQDSLYALFNGKPFPTQATISIEQLGMYDECSVTIFLRLLGGGRKRSVS
jgi:hypothetical protein